MYQPVNLEHKFSLFDAHWQPKVIAQMNDYQFKIVKIEGGLYGTRILKPMKHSSLSRVCYVLIFVTGMCSSIRGNCTWCQKV